MKRVARRHAAHREELQLAALRRPVSPRLRTNRPAPSWPQLVALRHEHFAAAQPQFPLSAAARIAARSARRSGARDVPLAAASRSDAPCAAASAAPADRPPASARCALSADPVSAAPVRAFFRSGGIALAIACRTIRRCTPCFFASPLIVSPAACPRRISSNSSTLRLLSIPECFHPGLSGGPNQTIKVGQIRRSNSRWTRPRTWLGRDPETKKRSSVIA